MDEERFDQVIISLAEKGSRRGVLGVMAATLGLGGWAILESDAADARRKKRRKKKSGSPPLPPPPSPNKQYQQACTPGTDVCASPYRCDEPTYRHQCDSTISELIGDAANWCCVPPGGACEGECGCCGNYYCAYTVGNTGTCQPL